MLDLFGVLAYNTKHRLSHNLFNHSLKLINPIGAECLYIYVA